MSISELIAFISFSLTTQNKAMDTAVKQGDLAEIVRLSSIIAETERTLAQLRTL